MTPYFEKLGYHHFKDNLFPLYAKKIREGWFLSLGLTIHRFYDDQFTVDLFLARYVAMNYLSFDIPKDSSKRIGELLSEKERLDYFGDSIIDHWWSLYNDSPEESIVELVKLVEPRLSNDKDLMDRIMKSREAQQTYDDVQEVTRAFVSGCYSHNPDYCPFNPKNDIPIDWFWAAETIMRNQGRHPSWVQKVAEQAYRQFVLETSNK